MTDLSALIRGACPQTAYDEARLRYAALPAADRTADLPTRSTRVYENLRRAGHGSPGPGPFEDPAVFSARLQWAAITDPSLFMATLIHHGMALGTLLELGDGGGYAARRTEQLATGDRIGVYAVTEAAGASGHASLATEARFDPATREFEIHTPSASAGKIMSNSGTAAPKLGVVYADLVAGGRPRGVFPFLVDLVGPEGALPGVGITPLHTPLLPLDYALVTFSSVRVPQAAWLCDGATLDAAGRFTDVAASPAERLTRSYRVLRISWTFFTAGLAAVTRAAAATAVEVALVRTVRARSAAGQPLLDLPSRQRALFGALATAYALTGLAHRVAERGAPDRGGEAGAGPAGGERDLAPWSAVNGSLSLAKAVAADRAARAIAECRLGIGVLGTLSSNRIVEYEGFAHACHAAGGDNTLIFFDTGRGLAEEALGHSPVPAEPTVPALPADPTVPAEPAPSADLTEPAAAFALLRARAAVLLEGLRSEVSRSRSLGSDETALWDAHFAGARAVGEAHGVVDMAGAMLGDLGRLHGTDRAVHAPLTALLCLLEVERHLDWYVTHGLLTVDRRSAVDQGIRGLCARLRPSVRTLLDALGVPPPTGPARP
ncbi:hypothetical protein ABT354_17445 [Streptomyces sp. NPDC000594]|uniref:acyl-CoA dehydrogenase family protein n=1 Tax=Streptomyces sp. NPDC000594 TaxID=3154261 RepID=UPI00331DF5E4